MSKYDVKICYNNSTSKWQYKYSPSNRIEMGYNITWCQDRISERHQVHLNSINQLVGITDREEIKIAIGDIEAMNQYPIPPKKRKYGIDSLYFYHEITHRDDFIDEVEKVYRNSDFVKNFESKSVSCDSIKSIRLFQYAATQFIEDLSADLRGEIRNALEKRLLRNEYEKETQTRAYNQVAVTYVKYLRSKLNSKSERG